MTPFLIFIFSVPHILFLFVPVIGLEPTRFWHMLLRHTWLPLHHTGELKRASRGIRTPESFRILITNQVQSATMRHWHFRRFVPSYNKSHQVPRQVWCWFYDDRLLSFATSLDVLLDFSCGYQPIDLFPHSKNTTKIYHIFQFSKS